MQMQARQLWQAVLGDMQTRLPRNAFDNWLRPTSLVAFENDVATVAAPHPFAASTLQQRYADQIERILSNIVGRPVRVEFTVQGDSDTDEAAADLSAFAPSVPRLPDRNATRGKSGSTGGTRNGRAQRNDRQLTGTYRLQLHAGFGFDAAREQLPYLASLGVSHLYLSPVLQAAPGSVHGYDVVDHSRIADALGGNTAHHF